MDITSIYYFIPIVASVFIYYLVNNKYRVLYLSLLSCGFIASLSLNLLIYVIGFSLINFYLGILIPASRFKKIIFRIGIIINLTQIILLKYASFTIDPVLQIFSYDLKTLGLSQIIIPLGISYFTLQAIGYLINIKMGWEKPEKKYLNFLLYIIFFPKFISGPIERSNHFLPQLNIEKSFSQREVTLGLQIILIGLFKKHVIANQLGLIVNPVYNQIDSMGTASLLLVILVQPLYIYFDFSGYTNIAIGLAKTFGLSLLPNFNRPLFSENVTAFWKRFHMSLSFWFNDYVFKQVSFRFRKWKSYASTIAVLITWLLFGIWHGAGWNFIVLGLLQATAIYFEYSTKSKRVVFFAKIPELMGKWMGRFMTYLFYGISLVFFFSPDLNAALKYFGRLRYLDLPLRIDTSDRRSLILSCIFVVIILLLEYLSVDKIKTYIKLNMIWNCEKNGYKILRYGLYYIILLMIIYFSGVGTEFIYFKF